MSISNDQYIAWTKRAQAQRCILVEAKYWDIAAGSEKTAYLSNIGYVTDAGETPSSVAYRELIINDVSRRIMHNEPLPVITIELANGNGDLDAWFMHGWDGRELIIYLGDPSWPRSDFRQWITGVVRDVSLSDGAFTLNVSDKKARLDKPLHEATYSGTDSDGQPMPTGLGKVFNAEPSLVSQALHAYQVHPWLINAITDVKDNGVSVAYTPNLSAGQFTLSAAPYGTITCDFEGEALTGYVSTIADIVERVLTYKGILPGEINSTSFAAFNAQFSMDTGRQLKEQINTITLIDEFLADVDGGWYFDNSGQCHLWWLQLPTGIYKHVVTEDQYLPHSFNVSEVESPIWKLKLGVKRNYTQQSKDATAASLTETEKKALAEEYTVIHTVEDSDLKTVHLLAREPDLKKTYLADDAAVGIEAGRQLALHALPHLYFSIKCTGYTPQTSQLDLRVGDEVLVAIGRAGFQSYTGVYRWKTLEELDWGVDTLAAYTLNDLGLTSTAILMGFTEYLCSGNYEMHFRK